MKQVLIIHGIHGHAGIHWQQWLHDELIKRSYQVIMPDLSNPLHPSRQDWLAEIKDVVGDRDTSELIVVGHSLGVTTALDFIEQSSTQVKGLVSVAGFASDYGAELNSYFLQEKTIDFNKVRSHLNQATVFFGDDDPYVAQQALIEVSDELKVQPVVIHEGGHLNTERGFTNFPDLLDAILTMN